MTTSARKITTAAVCTAVAVICCALSAYTPLSFTTLYFASFCIFLCFDRSNVVYGLLCAAATVGLTFIMAGLSVTFFMLILIFVPYGIICAAMKKFNYRHLKKGLIRAVVMLVAINVLLFLTYFTVSRLLLSDLPLIEWVDKFGYPIFALIATVIFAPLDVIFTETAPIVIKRISVGNPTSAKKQDRSYDSSKGETEKPPVTDDAVTQEHIPQFDVFDETEKPSDFAAHNGIKLTPDKATEKRKKSKKSDSEDESSNEE